MPPFNYTNFVGDSSGRLISLVREIPVISQVQPISVNQSGDNIILPAPGEGLALRITKLTIRAEQPTEMKIRFGGEDRWLFGVVLALVEDWQHPLSLPTNAAFMLWLGTPTATVGGVQYSAEAVHS